MQPAATPDSVPRRALPHDGSRTGARSGLRSFATHPYVLLSVGLLLLALLPRLLYVLWAPPFIGGDSLQYFQPVYDLMTSGKFTLTLKRPPLYPWLLYAEQVAFGPSFVPMIAFQHLLGAIEVVLTFWIGRLAWGGSVGRWAGALAAVLVAFSSPTLRWEHFLMTEGLFAFLLTLTVFLIAFVYSFVIKGVGGVGAEFLFHPFESSNIVAKIVLMPLNFLLKCVEELAKPLSLGLRLFGNMYAGEMIFILLATFTLNYTFTSIGANVGTLVQILLGTAWTIFHILIIALQAYIFMTLTTVYMAMSADHH